MRGKGRDLFPSGGKENQSRFSKQKARNTVETVFELVKKALESGEDVLISGFGKFIVRTG